MEIKDYRLMELILDKDVERVKERIKEIDGFVCDALTISVAAVDGAVEIMRCLVEAGADVHLDEDAAVRAAAGCGNVELVKYLVSVGADAWAKQNEAIKSAALKGSKEVVDYLVEIGASDVAKGMALIYAVGGGHMEIVKGLESKCVDFGDYLDRALMSGLEAGRLEIIKHLMSGHGEMVNGWALDELRTMEDADLTGLVDEIEERRALKRRLMKVGAQE